MSQRLQEVAKVTGIHLAENALGQIIKVAEGGLRDALSMLDQVASYGNGQVTLENVHRMLGTVNQDILENFTEYILAGEAGKCLVLLGEVYQQGQEIKLLAGALASHLREHMLRMVASPAEKNTLALDRLLTILNLITTVEQEMKWSTQPRVLLEIVLVRCCRFSQYETMVPTEQYRDLLLRIEQLENQLLDLSQDISFSNKPVADPNGERKISVSEDTFFEKQQDIEPKEVNKEGKKTIVKQPRQVKQEVVQSNLEHPAELTTGQRVKHIKEPLQYEGNSLANLGEHKDNKSLRKGKELDNSLLTKIMARWKDVLECINGAKTYHNIYSYLSKGTGAWPLGVKDGILTVGFWKKDSNALLASSMMELGDNKEPFQKILQSVCQESLHVRFVLTEDEPPQHSEVQASSLDIDDAANLFQGEEQEIPEDNPFD